MAPLPCHVALAALVDFQSQRDDHDRDAAFKRRDDALKEYTMYGPNGPPPLAQGREQPKDVLKLKLAQLRYDYDEAVAAYNKMPWVKQQREHPEGIPLGECPHGWSAAKALAQYKACEHEADYKETFGAAMWEAELGVTETSREVWARVESAAHPKPVVDVFKGAVLVGDCSENWVVVDDVVVDDGAPAEMLEQPSEPLEGCVLVKIQPRPCELSAEVKVASNSMMTIQVPKDADYQTIQDKIEELYRTKLDVSDALLIKEAFIKGEISMPAAMSTNADFAQATALAEKHNFKDQAFLMVKIRKDPVLVKPAAKRMSTKADLNQNLAKEDGVEDQGFFMVDP